MIQHYRWDHVDLGVTSRKNKQFIKTGTLAFISLLFFLEPLLANLSQWKNYSWKEIPSTRMGGYQDIVYNKSVIGQTEFLIIAASNGNPKGEPQVKKTEVRGGSWEQIVYAGNDDKSMEVWIRQVTEDNQRTLGEMNSKNAAAKVCIVSYDGLARAGKVVEKTLRNEAVAINGSGSAPFLVFAASDNGGSSDIAQVDYGNSDDRTWIYFTDDRTFEDSTAGKRRGAIAMVELLADPSTPKNQSPSFAQSSYSLKDANVNEYYAMSIYKEASDPDGGSLTFSKVNGPDWVKVSNDGWIEGQPTLATTSPEPITIKATDFGGLSAQASFYIKVLPLVNTAPVFNKNVFRKPNAKSYVDYKEPIVGQVEDQEGDKLIFSKVNGPKWLSVTDSGVIQGTPTPDDLGLNIWTVRVTDPSGLSDEATMNITVEESAITKVYPHSENPFEGEIVNGTLEKLHHNDNKYQVICEIGDHNERSKMYYFWEFEVPPAEITTIDLKAHRTENSEGDDFIVAYSINGSPYEKIFSIGQVNEEGSEQSYRFPSNTHGLLSIRISDSDRTIEHDKLDKIFIDSMVITSENVEQPSFDNHKAYPIAESSTEGDIINGSLEKLQTNDGKYQVIREINDQNERSKMFYFWEFNIPSAETTALEIKAHRTVNNEGDDFKAMYSTTGIQ